MPMGPARRLFRLPWRSAGQVAADVDAELEFHLAERTRDLMALGLRTDEARREAEREFGDVPAARASLREQDVRHARHERWTRRRDELAQDVVHAARQLRRHRGFALVAALTLALGIGATTAIYSVVDGVLLRPLPFDDPERIVTLWQSDPLEGRERGQVARGNFLDLRDRARTLAAVAAAEPYGFDLTGAEGRPETVRAMLVTSGWFDILGVRPLLGRGFLPAEHVAQGEGGVVLLGHALWQRRFGGDPAIVGRTITLDRRPHLVVGVLPPTARWPAPLELWAPVAYTAPEILRERGGGYIDVIGRMAPGASLADVRGELRAIGAQLARDLPRTNQGRTFSAVPLPDQVVAGVRPALLVLLGAVGCILLIGCANVANLLLARGSQRRRELAVRGALGASRGRLLRQLLTESALLGLLGCAGGLLLARWGVSALVALAPVELPASGPIGLAPRVLLFATGLSLVTVLLFGLVPALRFSRADVRGGLRGGGRGTLGDPGARRTRGLLVAAEVALSVVLLIGAGLLGRSLLGVLQLDPGYRARHVLAAQVFLWDQADAATPRESAALRVALLGDHLERLAALPGVQAVGAVSAPPFLDSRIDIESEVLVDGRPAPAAGSEPRAFATVATPGYFAAVGLPLRAGRDLAATDHADAPRVAVVNEAFVRRFFPGEQPVGRRVTIGVAGRPVPREIVGVVADARQGALELEPQPELFVPHAQSAFGSMTYVVRTADDAARHADAVRRAIWSRSPDLPIYDLTTFAALRDGLLAERRFGVLLVGLIAALALVLAAVGVYGVMSLGVRERTGEFGLRIALGARPRDVVTLTLRDGVALVGGGLLVGVAVSLALTRLLRSQLYGVSPSDPPTFAAVAVTLLAVALLASWLPARRAGRVDPVRTLQEG